MSPCGRRAISENGGKSRRYGEVLVLQIFTRGRRKGKTLVLHYTRRYQIKNDQGVREDKTIKEKKRR